VKRIATQAQPILQAGGAVWVQEAGQSNITADWIALLIKNGVAEARIKSNVIVVQHSQWNQKNTHPNDLSYVKAKTTYFKIEDGNRMQEKQGTWTPDFTSPDTAYLIRAKKSPNAHARALWSEAERLCADTHTGYDNPKIKAGGVDFSDVVEDWWIFFDQDRVGDLDAFWNRYVLNLLK
jgi:hypothetical protein